MNATNTAAGFTVLVVETPTLGDRSYLVHDGSDAFVVDPQRDLDRVETLMTEHGVTLRAVFETHIHNDYVSGGLALATRHGATYHVNAADQVSFARTPISDGDSVAVGDRMRVTALATPGHTFTHLSFALHDAARGAEDAEAVFSGGSMLFGATGRPDLLGPDHTDALAHHQHASVNRLADLLADDTEVFPTHGFGSFCSATQSEATSSTVGRERTANPALTQDAEAYIAEMLAGLDTWPAYYAHMGPWNAEGASAADLTLPAAVDATEVRRRLEDGEWVVDLRNRTAFAAGHAPGTVNVGADGALATYLGWIIPWGTPLTLVGDTVEQVTDAQRELSRIGIDGIGGQATGDPTTWSDRPLESFPRASFADLAQIRHHRAVHVLDVRREGEYAAAHLADAQHLPLHSLLERIDEVPEGEIWVHCAGGYRASIAASILAAAGRRPVAVDDAFDQAHRLGLVTS